MLCVRLSLPGDCVEGAVGHQVLVDGVVVVVCFPSLPPPHPTATGQSQSAPLTLLAKWRPGGQFLETHS